jgi:hypothetical protein
MMVWFYTVNPDGTSTPVREIAQSDIGKCPFAIFDARHYRLDGTCKCNEREHAIMEEWGYKWNGTEWTAGEHEGEDEC